jgi:hypothetical protein
MNAHDNLEEFRDPPNYDIEEGERSAPRIVFYCDLAKTVGGPALEIACRFTHPQELKALLHYNGFQILQQYGSWNKEPLSASSPSIYSICKRR